jgi:precorrin-3B C17-methyltransferase
MDQLAASAAPDAPPSPADSPRGRLFVVGLGPGTAELLTPQAREALAEAEVVVGYRAYLEQAGDLLTGKRLEAGELGGEVARAERAVALAAEGRTVALVSSGDAGVYGMASPALEALERRRSAGESWPDVEVVPGVSAALAAAALLGAPLGADFAVISLSDLLTPWELVERRVSLAAEADFVLAFYNPASQRRTWQFARACELLLQHRSPNTPVGVVRQAYRPEQEVLVTDLGSIAASKLDMTSIVLIGNSSTYRLGAQLVTPRGYRTTRS